MNLSKYSFKLMSNLESERHVRNSIYIWYHGLCFNMWKSDERDIFNKCGHVHDCIFSPLFIPLIMHVKFIWLYHVYTKDCKYISIYFQDTRHYDVSSVRNVWAQLEHWQNLPEHFTLEPRDNQQFACAAEDILLRFCGCIRDSAWGYHVDMI